MKITLPLLKVLSKLIQCKESELEEKLNHPHNIIKVNQFMDGKYVKTNYPSKLGEFREFKFGRLSFKACCETYAYEGYLNVTVPQHFYTRYRFFSLFYIFLPTIYRIKLLYPRMRCAVEQLRNSHFRFYPLGHFNLFYKLKS